jgi:hypothetical protein
MCYSKQLSIKSFLFGLFCGLILIIYGNKESSEINKVIGLFFIFSSFIQLIEYFLWKDINCKTGLNKLGFILGPIFNHLQPVILFILCSIFIKSSNIIPIEIVISIIILYIIYFIKKYNDYILDNPIQCVKTNETGHLNWPWKKDFNYVFYLLINLLVFINYYKYKNLTITSIFVHILLVISINKFNKNAGELWCYMSTGTPLLALFLQKILNINN